MHAIFYTHQTSGMCAGVCACNCMHQMEKTAYDVWFLRYGTWQTICCHSRPYFALLPPYGPRKSKFWKTEKKPEDIFIMCTINDSHIMYGSWDMECIGQNFFVTLDHFLPFYSPNNLKNNCLEISSFYTSVPKIMTTCYTVS